MVGVVKQAQKWKGGGFSVKGTCELGSDGSEVNQAEKSKNFPGRGNNPIKFSGPCQEKTIVLDGKE
jgi:hypothetical protein